VSEGFDIAALRAAVAAEGAVARVVVAEAAGSAPRGPGAAMLVGAASEVGTIGGGALELEATRAARALLARPQPWARQLLRLPLGPALGQCCGGHVTLLIERYDAGEVAAAARSASAGVYARPVTGGAPPGADLAAGRARRAARAGEGGPARLEAGLMIEPVGVAALPLWLYGAGHVGRAIVRAAEDLPIAVTWIDTARDRFPAAIPAHATRLVARNPARVAGRAPADAVHLVLTYSHALDLEICHAVLSQPFAQLGLIGSASKRARFLARLRALGHTDAVLARLECPIGDRSLGKRPAAIALGVVADLVRRAETGAAAGVRSA